MLEKNTYRVFSSPGDQDVQQCVLRMSKLVDMAKAVVEAEFPDLLVVTAFSVCALADAEKVVAGMAMHQTHSQRLAKLFSVDAQALASHIARHRPTPQAINNSTQCSEAWQQHRKQRKQYDQ
ncbi:MAG: hypothetical protein ACKPKO_52740, partial [Candidatus Fonsibacter sp.]